MDFNAPMQALWSYFNGNNATKVQPAPQPTQSSGGGLAKGPGVYKPFRPPENESYVDFYPTQKYIDKNQAPMKVPLSQLDALAKSEAIARKKGYFNDDTLKYYLPSALAEGRWDKADYGVNYASVNYGTNETKAAKEARLKAKDYHDQFMTLVENHHQVPKGINLSPTVEALHREQNKYNAIPLDDRVWGGTEKQQRLRQIADELGVGHLAQQVTSIPKDKTEYAKYDYYDPQTTQDINERASLKTLALANKYHENNGKLQGLPLWERYNGSGWEARRYVRRLKEADDLLYHPKNKDSHNVYKNRVKYWEDKLKD
jgi:hypothetical protein